MGTPAYMAPEQAFNDEVDFRADLYSLGATVYAMLTGRPPFERSGIALIQQLVRDAPRPPSQLAEGIPASLDKLVLRLLSKDPKDRGANASEIAEIFEGIARLRYRARLPEEPRRTGRRFASSDERPSLPEDRPALPGQTPPPGSPGA